MYVVLNLNFFLSFLAVYVGQFLSETTVCVGSSISQKIRIMKSHGTDFFLCWFFDSLVLQMRDFLAFCSKTA